MKKLFLFGLVFLILISSVSAKLTPPPNMLHYWNLSQKQDQYGSYNMNDLFGGSSVTHYPTFNVSGDSSPNSMYFTTNEYLYNITSLADSNVGFVSVWFNTTDASAQQVLWGISNRSANNQYVVLEIYKGRLAMQGDDAGAGAVLGDTIIQNGTWTHGVGISNGTAWSLYVNGVAQALTVDFGSNFGYWSDDIADGGVSIGVANRGANFGYFEGDIDEVKVGNIVPTEQQILNLFRYGNITGNETANFTVTANDQDGNPLTTFNLTIVNSSVTYTYTDAGTGTIETNISKTNQQIYNITISKNLYYSNTSTNYNSSNNYVAILSRGLATLTFQQTNGTALTNKTVNIGFPSGTSTNYTTDSSGIIAFNTSEGGTEEAGSFNITFLATEGYITPILFERTINAGNSPYTETFNISLTNININVYNRETGNLLTGVNVSLAILGLLNATTDNGTYRIQNLSISPAEYTAQALADGYGTEVQTFDYTSEENVTINFYLLNLSGANTGTLYVNTIDSFYRIIQGAKVVLMEYSPTELSFIEVSECLTNSNGECGFYIELNTKTYYIRATKTIGGVLYSASTNPEGEIILTNNEVRNLILYYSDTYTISSVNNLVYAITESFANNISSISVDFYTTNGLPTTLCIEYFIKTYNNLTSVTGNTYCLASTSAVQNIGANILLNRSNYYVAKVYISGTEDINLETFYYPDIESIGEILDDDTIGVLLTVLWLSSLALMFYLKNVTYWFVLAIFLSWTALTIFPLYTSAGIAVFRTILSGLCFLISRKRKDTE